MEATEKVVLARNTAEGLQGFDMALIYGSVLVGVEGNISLDTCNPFIDTAFNLMDTIQVNFGADQGNILQLK